MTVVVILFPEISVIDIIRAYTPHKILAGKSLLTIWSMHASLVYVENRVSFILSLLQEVFPVHQIEVYS